MNIAVGSACIGGGQGKLIVWKNAEPNITKKVGAMNVFPCRPTLDIEHEYIFVIYVRYYRLL